METKVPTLLEVAFSNVPCTYVYQFTDPLHTLDQSMEGQLLVYGLNATARP
jgi:hypothetical protein